MKPPGKRYIFTKELELTELVFDEQTQGQVSLFEPVHDLTPTNQLLHDVGKEPVGCGSEMVIESEQHYYSYVHSVTPCHSTLLSLFTFGLVDRT